MNSEPLPNLGTYFRNRALRVLPAYWAILFATAVLLPAAIVPAGSERHLGRLIERPTVLFRNTAFLQNYFADSMDTGILPAWSLAVEVAFYAVLPLLGVLAASLAIRASTRTGRTLAALTPPALLFAVGMLAAWARVSPSVNETVGSVLGRSFLHHADLFAFGLGLAVLMVSIEDGVVRLPAWWRVPTYGMLGVLTFTTVLLVDRGLIYTFIGAVPYELLTGTVAVLLLALVVLPSQDHSSSIVARILSGRMLAALGLISYSLFLWHEPLQRLAAHQSYTIPGVRGFWVNLLTLGLISVALAALTYRFVERPALARKHRMSGEVSESAEVVR